MAQAELPDISAHPLNSMDTEVIETAAATIEALGTTVGDNGTQAVTAWSPISTAYKGPGDVQLLAVMTPVGTMSTAVKDRTAAVAKSLRAFKDAADDIKVTMTTLKADLITHTANVNNYEPPAPVTTTTTGSYGAVPGSSGSYHGSWDAYGAASVTTDWRNDAGLVAENEQIVKGLNTAVERMHEAERQCMTEIRGLNSLSALTAGDGGYGNGEYGVETIPHAAQTPWGTASPDDETCGEAAWSWVVDVGKDFVGLFGGQWDEDGTWSWSLDNVAATWTGMAGLISYNSETGQWGDVGHLGDSWFGVLKDFVAADRWEDNPQGAFTDLVLNVGTTFIAGAGVVTKILKVGRTGRKGDVDTDADVDFDGSDFDVPEIRVDVDTDVDFDTLDLDLDVPGDRRDVPANAPNTPANSSEMTGSNPDAHRDGGADAETPAPVREPELVAAGGVREKTDAGPVNSIIEDAPVRTHTGSIGETTTMPEPETGSGAGNGPGGGSGSGDGRSNGADRVDDSSGNATSTDGADVPPASFIDPLDHLGPADFDRSQPGGHLVPESYDRFGDVSQDVFLQRHWNHTKVNSWDGSTGGWIYPPHDGFDISDGTPRPREVDLPRGFRFDRFGGEGGVFVSPEGSAFPDRALPPDSLDKPYHVYEVIRTFDDTTDLPVAGRIAGAFEQPGGGIQLRLPQTVQWLLDNEYIKEVQP